MAQCLSRPESLETREEWTPAILRARHCADPVNATRNLASSQHGQSGRRLGQRACPHAGPARPAGCTARRSWRPPGKPPVHPLARCAGRHGGTGSSHPATTLPPTRRCLWMSHPRRVRDFHSAEVPQLAVGYVHGPSAKATRYEPVNADFEPLARSLECSAPPSPSPSPSPSHFPPSIDNG